MVEQIACTAANAGNNGADRGNRCHRFAHRARRLAVSYTGDRSFCRPAESRLAGPDRGRTESAAGVPRFDRTADGGCLLHWSEFGAASSTCAIWESIERWCCLDDRRAAPSSILGTTDTNLLPQELIKRVDIVTGGASAAYGSDAVSGVVNFILDTDFQGLKGSLQGGTSTHNDAGSGKITLTGGTDIFGGKGHIVFSGSYYDSSGDQHDRPGLVRPEVGSIAERGQPNSAAAYTQCGCR